MEKKNTKRQKNNIELGHISCYNGSAFGFLLETAKKFPNYIAIDFFDKKTTYKKLCRQIIGFADELTNLKIGVGDFVTIIAPNMTQTIIAFYAVNKIGAIANILHPDFSKNEIESIVIKTKSKAVIILDSLYEKVKNISFESLSAKLIVMSMRDDVPFNKKLFVKPSIIKNSALIMGKMIKDSGNFEGCIDNGDNEAVAVVMYSGGTTGTPKGVMLTNKNINCLPVYVSDMYGSNSIWGVKSLALMPIFHGFGLTVSVHGMLCNAGRLYLVPNFDAKKLPKLIFRKKINLLYAVPAFYEALVRSKEIDTKKCDFLQNIVSGGDGMNEKLMKKLNDRLRSGGSEAHVREAYGLTECSAAISINPYSAIKQNSVGLPFANVTVKITDIHSQNEVEAGEIGEICVSGPNVMTGYYDNEEETNNALKTHSDGKLWLHTKDLGYVDNDGYLFVTGRISNFFISGGYNIFPSQIEKAAMMSGVIQDCCAIGIDDRVLGKRGKLFVVPSCRQDSEEKIKKTLLQSLMNNIPEYAIPKEIEIMDSLPRTKMHKIDYEKLKEQNK